MQLDAFQRLFRGLRPSPLALLIARIAHVVGLIEDDDPIEVRPEPRDDLVEPVRGGGAPGGFSASALLGVLFVRERVVGGEQEAFVERDRFAVLGRFVVQAKQRLGEAHPFEVAVGVFEQCGVLRDPEPAPPPSAPVVEEDAGDLGALADPGAIPDEITEAKPVRQHLLVGLPGARHPFELRLGEVAVLDDGFGEVRRVAKRRRRHRAHRGGLGERRGVGFRARYVKARDVGLKARLSQGGGLTGARLDR